MMLDTHAGKQVEIEFLEPRSVNLLLLENNETLSTAVKAPRSNGQVD